MILSRTRSDRRDRYLCRCGVMLVICSLLVNMVAVPKAKAVAVVDDVALGAAATAAYLTSTGIPLTVTAGGASAASAGIVAVAGEYAAATGAAASGEALLTTIAAGTALTTAGAVVLTAAAAAAVGALAYWVYQTYSVDTDNEIYNNRYTVLADGSYLTLLDYDVDSGRVVCAQGGKLFNVSRETKDFPLWGNALIRQSYTGNYIEVQPLSDITHAAGNSIVYSPVLVEGLGVYLALDLDNTVAYLAILFNDGSQAISKITDKSFFSGLNATSESLSLGNITYSPIPEIAPAKQLELDIAAPPELELADLPEYTMNKVAAGDWSQPSNVPYSVTSAEPDPVPDPDPAEPGGSDPTVSEDTPDIEDLGLPELGAALITRFPFSIPWDVARAIKLIAAPAEAPYWEVDFLSVIGHRFPRGLGDTKIVLDFGEPKYEIIGIASRWTSTIGFCLALAAATKRFIWTA